MIEAQKLCKDFPAVRAVHGVSFRVEKGEAVGFLGPNGAGKTTTFRMLAGTLGPTSGRVLVQGKDLSRDPIGAKRLIGYMPEVSPLYPELTTGEYLRYRAELKGVARKRRAQAVDAAAGLAQASHQLGTRISHLSKGYRRRVALADALLGDPPVLLLDEPTAGLDPNQVLDVRELIARLATDHAILISTHVLSEVEATCQRAIVIHNGTLIAQGTLEELNQRRRSQRGQVTVAGSLSSLQDCLQGIVLHADAELHAQGEAAVCGFELLEPDLISRVVKACVDAGLPVLEAGPVRKPLDDVFAQLTKTPERELR